MKQLERAKKLTGTENKNSLKKNTKLQRYYKSNSGAAKNKIHTSQRFENIKTVTKPSATSTLTFRFFLIFIDHNFILCVIKL